jgi:hypothetical protein
MFPAKILPRNFQGDCDRVDDPANVEEKIVILRVLKKLKLLNAANWSEIDNIYSEFTEEKTYFFSTENKIVLNVNGDQNPPKNSEYIK